MKNKLFALFFLFVILSACERKTEILIAQSVPDTETFSLFDVLDAVYGSHASGNLADAFAFSDAAKFDPAYGSKTMSPQTLLGFRNYGGIAYGYDDWHLPTRNELTGMSSNLWANNIGSLTTYTGYEFHETYCSGEEVPGIPDTDVYGFQFGYGEVWGLKSYLYYVRAVRSYTSITSYVIGGEGQAGGWVFYKDGNNYKECAPSDQSAGTNWTNAITICNDLIIYH